MSNEKANISKVKKQKLLSGEETKTVFPVTIDEAVKVKRGDDKYTTLTNALKSKISDGLVIAAADTNDTYVYYLFTFNTSTTMGNSEIDRRLLRTALSCTNAEFTELCHDNGEEVSINYTYEPLSRLSLEERVSISNYVKGLFLNVIPLHSSGIPTIHVVDEQGNEYGKGDTIYFARYPGRLHVITTGLDLNYPQYLNESVIQGNKHGLRTSSEDTNETDTELVFSTVKSGSILSASSFSNPCMYPSDFPETTVTGTEAFMTAILKGYIYIEVMPVDYPWGDGVAQDTYETKIVRGKMYIDDLIYKHYGKDDQEVFPTPFGLDSCWFNIVFALTPDFVMQEPRPAVIWKQTNWTGEFVIRGVNAAAADTITLNIADDTYEYLFKRKEDSNYTTFDNIQLTGEEVSSQTGVTLQVRPADYREDEYYVPFELEEATLYNTTVGIMYNGVQKGTTKITLDVREEDFEEPFIIVEDTLYEDGAFYHLLDVHHKYDDLILFNIWITPEYTMSFKYVAANADEHDVSTILDRLEEEEVAFTEVSMSTPVFSRHITVTDSHKLLVKLEIQPNDPRNTPRLQFYVKIKSTTTGKEEFNIEYKEEEDPGTSQYKPTSFEGDTDNTAALTATDRDTSVAISRLLDNGLNISSTIVTIRDLKHITPLRDGIFSGLKDLTDASFMQYMTRITEIPKCAFYGCTSLERVIIPEGVTSIGDEAFAGCASLTEIVIPNSVTKIGRRAFIGCTGLTKIDFGTGVMTLGGIGLTESDNLNTIILRGIEPIPDSDPVAMRGVNLEAMMGLHISNRICFSLAIQGEGSSNVTFYVPEDLLDGYPEMNWGQFFPNATWEDLDNLPTEE